MLLIENLALNLFVARDIHYIEMAWQIVTMLAWGLL
jgi:hypothetical protein